MTLKRWLIVDGRGDMRIVTRQPNRLAFDEIAFPLSVTMPDTWHRIYHETPIEIVMPEPPLPSVEVGAAQEPERLHEVEA